MTGIIGAMEEEVAIIKDAMENVSILKRAGMEFYRGKLKGRETVVVRSGIGKVNAAACAQILCDIFAVDTIINTGIAGSLKNEINIGDIVLSTEALQHDVDATGFGYQAGEIPRMNRLAFPCDEELMRLAESCCKKVNPDIGVHCGRVLSGDQFVSDYELKKKISDKFSGYCTEMEGAAIAQAAYLNGVRCLIIRAISDKADGDAVADYPAFEAEAIRHCVNLTMELMERI